MTTTTLEAVRIEIEHWRGTREKTGRIPNRIWSQAIRLLDKHSMSEICRALRLSHTQLKNKIKQRDPFTLKSDMPFYEVAMPSIKHQQTDVHLGACLEIKRPDGTLMTIRHASDSVLINMLSSLIRSC
tara:strand:- start:1173 stop:1556 length:384 start_codon:yes stop_codon:yes gene_type:complete